jgi:hypothetical protein
MAVIAMLASLLLAPAMPPCVKYDLSVSLAPDQKTMSAVAIATLPTALRPTTSVTFKLSELMSSPEVALIDGAQQTSLTPKEGKTEDRQKTWGVTLPKQIPAGGPVTLQIKYGTVKNQGFVFYIGPEGSFAGGPDLDWYPRFDEYRCTGKMTFDVPKGIVVHATGIDSPAKPRGDRDEYDFDVTSPSSFTFAAAKYIVQQVPGRVPITLYTLKPRANSQAYADGCQRILAYLPKEFGPYPYPNFAIVEVPSGPASGSGFSGASFEQMMFADTSSLDAPFNLAYFAHEISHQWWGNLIQKSGDKGAYMLDEGLAQFGSLQAVQHTEGTAMAALYRSKGYPDYAADQSGYWAALFAFSGLDKPLSSMPSDYDVVYHELANSKGFLTWDTLAYIIGRDRFRHALQAVTKKYAWQNITWEQFLAEIKVAAGQNIDLLLSQWLDRPGMPTLWTTVSQAGDAVRCVVHQKSPFYTIKIPVRIDFDGGVSITREALFSGESIELDIRSSAPVRAVLLDPDSLVLHSTPDLDEEAVELAPYSQGTMQLYRGDPLGAIKKFQDGLMNLPANDRHGVEFRLATTLGALSFRGGKMDEAKAYYEEAIGCAVRDERLLPFAFMRLALIARSKKNAASVARLVGQMLAAESKLSIPSGALDQAAAAGLSVK